MAKKSILTDNMEVCYLCKSPYIEVHHVMYGTANRKISDKYGLVLPLCHAHHTGINGVHFNHEMNIKLREYAQQRFEEVYPNLDFRSIFGKSYL